MAQDEREVTHNGNPVLHARIENLVFDRLNDLTIFVVEAYGKINATFRTLIAHVYRLIILRDIEDRA